jgi:hypothetical protein
MTPISQEDRELLNSLETYQLIKNSPFNNKTVNPSTWSRIWEATLGGLIGMLVAPWVFCLFVLAVGFSVHYFFNAISWSFTFLISLFRTLGKA